MDFDNFEDFIKNLNIEDFKNFGKRFLKREDVLERIQSGQSLAGAVIEGIDLSGIEMKGGNLENATIMNTVLKGADLENARLSGATLIQVDLSRAELMGADLSDATIANTIFDSADLTGACLSTVKFSTFPVFTRDPADIRIPPDLEEMIKTDPSKLDVESLELSLEDFGLTENDFNEAAAA